MTIVTPHPYSHLRLDTLGREFGLDLSQCRLETLDDFLRRPAPSFMLTMGNHILPPIDARAPHAIYLCQFPFRPAAGGRAAQGSLEGYQLHHRLFRLCQGAYRSGAERKSAAAAAGHGALSTGALHG